MKTASAIPAYFTPFSLLRRFGTAFVATTLVRNDQVTVVNTVSDTNNLVDTAVTTDGPKVAALRCPVMLHLTHCDNGLVQVSLVFLGSAVSLEVVLGYY